MARTFKLGDHVEWNSEAGRVRGVIFKKVVSDVQFKGYAHHASTEEPQFLIKSDKTDHVAIHKGRALKLTTARAKKKLRKTGRRTPTLAISAPADPPRQRTRSSTDEFRFWQEGPG